MVTRGAIEQTAKIVWEAGKALGRWRGRPKLRIEKIYVQNFGAPLEPSKRYLRRFVIATVRNVGKRTALRCMGYLYSQETRQEEFKLHWADTPYTRARDTAEPVDIVAGETRDLDIAFSVGGKVDDITLAREDTFQSSPTYHAVVGGETLQTELARESIIDMKSTGAWIAIPIALRRPVYESQAYLKPGEYDVTVKVQPNLEGEGDELKLKIISEVAWDKLDALVYES